MIDGKEALALSKKYTDKKLRDIVAEDVTFTRIISFKTKYNAADLVGTTFLTERKKRHFLVTPNYDPAFDEYTSICVIAITDGENFKESPWGAGYTDNGTMDRKALMFDGGFGVCCPTFFMNYPGYDTLGYFFGETHDTLGLGITVQRGWYAINSKTFALTPFDLDTNPFVINDLDTLESAEGYDIHPFFYDLFKPRPKVTFTVTEDNLCDCGGVMAISYAHVPSTNDAILGLGNTVEAGFAKVAELALTVDGSEDGIFYGTFENASIVESVVTKKLDPKFLPGGVLPVVELPEEDFPILEATNAVALSDTTAAKLEQCYANGMPFILLFHLEGYACSGVAIRTVFGEPVKSIFFVRDIMAGSNILLIRESGDGVTPQWSGRVTTA